MVRKKKEIEPLVKELSDIDLYLNMVTFKATYPIEKIMAFAADLYRMVLSDETMVNVGPWIQKHGLSSSTISRWRKKYEEFDRIYRDSLQMIGYRMQTKGLNGTLDGNLTKFLLPAYSSEARASKRFDMALKKEIANAGKSANIIIYKDGAVPDTNDQSSISITIPKLEA